MANKITISGGLKWNDGTDSLEVKVSITATQTGTQAIGNVQNIGTSAEAIVLGDVTTIGYIGFKNKDETNYVEIDNATPLGSPAALKLLPGEGVVLPTRLTAWYAKANTAAVDLLVVAVEL